MSKEVGMDGATNRGGDDQTRILPELSVRHGRAAVEFYKAAFGAVEEYRVGGTDDEEAVVAQLSVGSAAFWPTSRRRTRTSAPSHWARAPCECC
jgi:hypothetical protein